MSSVIPRSAKQGRNGLKDESKNGASDGKRAFDDIYRAYKGKGKISKNEKIKPTRPVRWEAMLPAKPCFKARLLGMNFYGRFIVQVDDNHLPKVMEVLTEFYSEEKTREQYRIPSAELRVGLLVYYIVSGMPGRGEVKYVDCVLHFCSVEDVDTAEFHAVGFENIYWLDEAYQAIPRKAIQCELDGLKQENRDALVRAFTKIRIKDDGIRVTIKERCGANGFPVVSIVTRGDHKDLLELFKMALHPTEDKKLSVEETKKKKPFVPKNDDIARAYEEAQRDIESFFENSETQQGIPLKKVYGKVTSTTGRPIHYQKMGFPHWYTFLYYCDRYFYLKASRPDKTGTFLVFPSKVPDRPNNPPGFQRVESEILLSLLPGGVRNIFGDGEGSLSANSTEAKQHMPAGRTEAAGTDVLHSELNLTELAASAELKLFGGVNTTKQISISVKQSSQPELCDIRMGNNIDFTLTRKETPYVFWTDQSGPNDVPTPPRWNEKLWKEKDVVRLTGLSEPGRLKCVGMPPISRFNFPAISPFKAKLLGADSYGFMHISVEDFIVEMHYKDLETSIAEFYEVEETRTAYLLTVNEIKSLNCSNMVVVRRDKNFLRARVFEIDVNQRLCIFVGADDPEFFFANFDCVYRIDPQFEHLPSKAKMCILAGLEQHVLTDHVAEAIEKTPLGLSLVHVNIINPRHENFGVPCVSMTWNGQDFYSLLKERAGELLRTVSSVEMEGRVSQQLKILEHLKRRKYLPLA